MKKQILASSLVTLGFLIGATALSAAAGTWTPPTVPAPGGNPDAPLNVGSIKQFKLGKLSIGADWTLPAPQPTFYVAGNSLFDNVGITGNFIVATGTDAGSVQGKILAAIDNNGTVGWRDASASCQNGFPYYQNGSLTCKTTLMVTQEDFVVPTFWDNTNTACSGSRQGGYAICPGPETNKLPPTQANLRVNNDSTTMTALCVHYGYSTVKSFTSGSGGVVSDTDRYAWNASTKQWYTADFALPYLSTLTCQRTVVN